MFLPGHEKPLSPELERTPTEHLEQQVVEIAGQIAATMCRWLTLIAELDRRRSHEGWGFRTLSGWLAWQCSLDGRSSREHVRVARALAELPAVRESFGRGELSFSKVRAITRIATPETEAELVELARHATAAQVDSVVRDYGRSMSAAAAFDAHEARFLDHRLDGNGCLRVSACLSPEQGAAFLRALEAAETFEEDEKGGSVEPRARRADAVVRMAETFLASDTPPRRPGESREVVVHVDAQVLAEDAAGRCHIEAGPRIAAETARRFCCDTSLVAMLDGPKGPIGRRS